MQQPVLAEWTTAPGDNAKHRKARGAFFTPPAVADTIVRWAVRTPGDRVLEPSCGEAVFLRAAGRRLRELTGGPVPPGLLHGVELHADTVHRADEVLAGAGLPATIRRGDFLEVPARPEHDVVVGNPPFIRYQGFTGDARLAGQRAAAAQGVKLTGLASSWAPFVVHAAGLLRPGGRLGMVLPGELLNRNYAGAVRQFLLQRFARVTVVLFERRIFPEVSEEVVLLLAEGQGGCDGLRVHHVGALEEVAALLAVGDGDATWSPPAEQAPWTAAHLPPGVLDTYAALSAGGAFAPLQTWGAPRLGIVTGSNRFFMLTALEVADRGLGDDDVVPVSPPGSRHLRSLSFSARDWAGMGESGAAVYLFRPAATDEPSLSAGARRLIREGRDAGVADAYKCRVRRPWWRVPDQAPPDAFVTYMNHDAVQLASNDAGVRCVNSVHGLRFDPDLGPARALLPLSAMNSVSRLSGELVGRSFGGGMLQLLPREAARLLVPGPELLRRCADDLRGIEPGVRSALRRGEVDAAVEAVDEVVLGRDRLGTGPQVGALRAAHAALRGRRMSRSGGAAGYGTSSL